MKPINISLKFAKSTKGTHVYEMRNEAGVAMGSVYLPKLVIGEEAPAELSMVVSAKLTEDQAERIAEREMDRLDARFKKGEIHQAQYDAGVAEIDRRVARRTRQAS